MSWWKQLGLTLAVAVAAVIGWALYVPAAQPWLDRAGLLEPLKSFGLVADPPADEAGPGRSGGGPQAPMVVAAEAAPRTLTDRVTSIGSARGLRSVVIEAEVTGQIVALSVAPGQYVEEGAVLAELDSEAARIAGDRATLVLADAQVTLDRLRQLQARGATTELQVQEAELALKTAELALRDAEFELSRHRIVAPFSGWVGILAVELGDRVEPGLEITRLEDRSGLLVDFRVPERVVSLLSPGLPVTASPLADPGRALQGRISALDNRVDEESRSLLVQARIENADDALRAGMAFSITLEFAGGAYPAVDPLAIQWDAAGSFIWVVREGKAARVPVRIVQRNADAVLVEAALAPGDLVVTQGMQSLRPGSEVRLAPGDGAEAASLVPPATRG